ncbi:hypothetical protein Vadar_007227 [Vaccinium darrowii]|uniref:Uncharacterized protein n=1 Tax=Vaccinium darrowii TaxID=229202 RepID=A0ACB7Y5K2_9ERIC|nr:hypothetical protein Vadar_007227 [Vaccinium darrowii]
MDFNGTKAPAPATLRTARDNLVFLYKWFVKFPQYRNRSLFITGESYAGHYMPQPAELMLQFNKKEKFFNLKGLALGNPVLEFATDFNSRAEFFWSHGLISDPAYKLFTSTCNYSRFVSEYYRGSVSQNCSRVMSLITKETSRFVDNILDYELLDVETPTISLVGKITKAGIPVLVYSGDQDSVIPLTGSGTLVRGLMPVYEEVVLFFKVYWLRLNVFIAFGSLPRCCCLESI